MKLFIRISSSSSSPVHRYSHLDATSCTCKCVMFRMALLYGMRLMWHKMLLAHLRSSILVFQVTAIIYIEMLHKHMRAYFTILTFNVVAKKECEAWHWGIWTVRTLLFCMHAYYVTPCHRTNPSLIRIVSIYHCVKENKFIIILGIRISHAICLQNQITSWFSFRILFLCILGTLMNETNAFWRYCYIKSICLKRYFNVLISSFEMDRVRVWIHVNIIWIWAMHYAMN